MTRKRWRIAEQMLVPAVWQGSVEHFYHFLMGYFVPLVRWQEESHQLRFAVRNCGPMNSWLDLLRPETQLTYLAPGVMLERFLSHRQERVVLRSWDDPQRFHSRTLAFVRETITRRVGESTTERSAKRIVVIDRRRSSDFYRSPKAEVQGSGAEERSVPNMKAIGDALTHFGEVLVVDAASLSPADQVRMFAGTQLLIAQHGAGLANSLWLPSNASVIEIQPPLPPIIDTIFPHLAAALDLDYAVIRQPNPHAVIDPEDVVGAAADLLANPGTRVPARPGRWPTRIIRRLPRRLS